MENKPSTVPHFPVSLSIVIIIVLMLLLGLNVWLFGDRASEGANQVALVLMSAVILFFGRYKLGLGYQEMEDAIFKSLFASIPACFILFMIGPLISLWIVGGVVPGMIYYGLELIHPLIFLPISFLCCCIVSVSIGSSWSTIGTVGIALVGIGSVLGLPVGMSAGAVISGAYFGDKMSPLSDTTNMSSAIAEVDLFTHVRYMLFTTIPAGIITVILFTIIGITQSYGHHVEAESIVQMQNALKQTFHISPLIFLPPLLVLGLVYKKIPPIPAIFIGCLGGLACAYFLQMDLLLKITEQNGYKNIYATLLTISGSGPVFDIQNDQLNSLLNRGGMASMLTTVWFILAAMFFGGTIEVTGAVHSLTRKVVSMAQSAGSLVGTTIATCFIVNITTCEQYLAIALPGKLFKKSFEDMNLAPENLSRALEDGGTMTAVLIPWNTGAVYATGVLGISPLTYVPYCLFNFLCPLTSIFMAAMNIKIQKLSEKTEQ